VRRAAFLRSNAAAARALARKLDRLLKDPDAESVHDARTAVRKVDAHLSLLPKNVRVSREVRELLKRHRRLMERSAEVRDLDVIKEKISGHPGTTAEVLKALEKRRRRAAKDVTEAAASARKLRVPAAKVTEGRLRRRFVKVVGRLQERIEELLPVVIGDPQRQKELHSLRVDCKRLRYTLELAIAKDSPVLRLLQWWQDALGSIHDWDVTIAYLRETETAETGLLKAAAREREREFEGFARSVSSQPVRFHS
jgi:CHAD domain-containing protein